jgi:hypothetical protein
MTLPERLKDLSKEHGGSQAHHVILADADRVALLHMVDSLPADARVRGALDSAG